MKIQYIYAPFDHGSRSCGASKGAAQILSILEQQGLIDNNVFHLDRAAGEYGHNLIYPMVRKAVSMGCIPFVIGGDHRISANSVLAVKSYYPDTVVAHFDAHHDAYEETSLSHYSVMSFLEAQHVKIFGFGYRYQLTGNENLLEDQLTGPTYISLDFDFFSPELIPSVGHPVTSTAMSINMEVFEHALKKITGPIVGLDLVEWFGSKDEREISFAKDVICAVTKKVENASNR